MHVQSNRTRTRVHLYCTHSISGIQHMVYQIPIKVVQKHESHSLRLSNYAFHREYISFSKHVLSDTCHTCHGKIVKYYERIVVLKHISGNLLLQRVHP